MTPLALPHLAIARVSGTDSGAFLQAQLSADIAALADGGATFACYCSPRGQVFGLLLVCRLGEDFMLVADSGLLPVMIRRLGLFVLRARVVLELMDGLVVQGCPVGTGGQDVGMEFQPGALGLVYRLVDKTPGLAEDRGHWKEQELRRNVVWLGAATTERFIPQMLGMDGIGAVSFRKGCYPGQEVIARARYLGKVKRKPLLLELLGVPRLVPGEPLRLLDGENWLEGTVVDSVVLETAAPAEATLVFAVAPVPEGSIETVAYGDCDYRCATM